MEDDDGSLAFWRQELTRCDVKREKIEFLSYLLCAARYKRKHLPFSRQDLVAAHVPDHDIDEMGMLPFSTPEESGFTS